MTYKDSSTALSTGTFTSKTLDLAIGVHFIVLQNRHLDLLGLVLDLLRCLDIHL